MTLYSHQIPIFGCIVEDIHHVSPIKVIQIPHTPSARELYSHNYSFDKDCNDIMGRA